MGCDIHFHSEVKINGVWHHYAERRIYRNYELFAKMGDVRNKDRIHPIARNRGIPDDATELTKFFYKKENRIANSANWLGADEIAHLTEWCEERFTDEYGSRGPGSFWFVNTFGYFFDNTWRGFSKYPEQRPDGVEDIRFVFWFD